MIALLAVALLIASCGGSVSVNNRGEVAVGAKTLDVASIPFTFRYPTSFQEATDSSVKAAHAVGYGFSARGNTWLIECRSNASNRASMEQWCAEALDSLKLRA